MKQRQEQKEPEFELNGMIEPDIAERMAQDRDHRLSFGAYLLGSHSKGKYPRH